VGLKCNDIEKLGKIIEVNSSVDISTDGVKKYTFTDGFIVNIFSTGSVNFQGKASDCNMKETITTKIKAINELEKPLPCDK
jgi:predicted nucleotide-binding protein